MIFGTIAAFLNGAAFPAFNLVFGEMTDSFGPSGTPDEVVTKSGWNAL